MNKKCVGVLNSDPSGGDELFPTGTSLSTLAFVFSFPLLIDAQLVMQSDPDCFLSHLPMRVGIFPLT